MAPEQKAKIAALADVARQAMGTLLGQPFQWDGRLQSRNANVVDIYSGSGVPSTTNIPGQAKLGAVYFRIDGGGVAASNVYVCTVAGAPGTWLGIA
jgi:hypothetical protein